MITTDQVFQQILYSMYSAGLVHQFVIDEAHCVSQWGNSFRPSYLSLTVLQIHFKDVPIALLTATATAVVIKDVLTILGLDNVPLVQSNFVRPTLLYSVLPKSSKTIENIAALLKPIDCSLIYCSNRNECEQVAAKLEAKGIACKAYHGAMSRQLRSVLQSQWISGQLQSLCCTSAFGMGIDKPNARTVVHYSIPSSLEDYYQQSGRGGRDGLLCECVIYFSANDQVQHVRGFFTAFLHNVEALTKRLKNFQVLMNYCLNQQKCKHELIMDYFGQRGNGRCGNRCDICIAPTNGVEIDITDVAVHAGKCIQHLRNNGKQLTLRQLAGIITGKKSSNILKNKFNEIPGYGCHNATLDNGVLLLRSLVACDILREVPPSSLGKHGNALYIELGSNFIASLNKELQATYYKLTDK